MMQPYFKGSKESDQKEWTASLDILFPLFPYTKGHWVSEEIEYTNEFVEFQLNLFALFQLATTGKWISDIWFVDS